MSVLLIVLAVLCVLVGIAGCILPVLPGPPLSFVALLLMRWSGAAEFDSRFLTIWGARDARGHGARLPAAGLAGASVRRLETGGPRLARRVDRRHGILSAGRTDRRRFRRRLVGELIHDGSDKLRALRVAVSSFAAFILGTGMKLAVSLAIGFYVIRALFV